LGPKHIVCPCSRQTGCLVGGGLARAMGSLVDAGELFFVVGLGSSQNLYTPR